MKLINVAAAFAVLATVVAPSIAVAGAQDFTLVNSTGYTIAEVYVAPSRTDDWEEDVLGRDTLSNRQSVDISFDRGTDACRYDLKVVYDDGEEAEWGNLNLCEISSVKISYNRRTGATSAETE